VTISTGLWDRLIWPPIINHLSRLEETNGGITHGLRFKYGLHVGPENASSRSSDGEKKINLRHNKLVTAAHSFLKQRYGEHSVGTNIYNDNGTCVDVVVIEGNGFSYFEIKTGDDIKTCIREAVGQLLEYSYWSGGDEAKSLIIVTENQITPEAYQYLKALRERFSLPIYYQRLDVKSKTLGDIS